MLTLTKETASEYDFAALIDASGSMANKSTRLEGKNRWEELQESLLGLTTELDKLDDDGITVGVFGGTVNIYDGVSTSKVSEIFSSRGPRGGTPLAEALQAIVDKQKASGKKMVCFVYTDGVPDDHNAVVRVITDAANSIETEDALSFEFIQVGDDVDATKFLTDLDDHITAKFDIVDTVSVPEADSMSVIDLINKAIND